MKLLRVVLLLLALPSCEKRIDEGIGGTLTVTLPWARADGTHPVQGGGTIPVMIWSSLAEPDNQLQAKVELVPLFEGDVATSALVPLRTSDSGELFARAELKVPRGGRILVRAQVGTSIGWAEANVDIPAVAFDVLAPEALGGTTRVPVCIETTAVNGVLTLTLTDATFAEGAESSDVMIVDGRCASSPLGAGTQAKRANAVITTTAAKFTLTALLPGTNASRKLSFDFSAREGLVLALTASAATPPAAGQAIELDVEARALGGAPAASVPVKFETAPSATILPAATVTDEFGRAHATLLVPENSSTVRIDVVAGQERTGVTLAR